MSESPNEDAKRRERARRVDALTDASRQPGEGPRLGTRIAGAVAVVALAAGATLGIGAWNSYQTEQQKKEAAAKAAHEREQAAAARRVKESPSPSASASKQKEEPQKHTKEPTSRPADEVEKPRKTVKKPEPDVRLNEKTKKGGAGYSRIVLANKASNMCADLPGFDGHPEGGPVNQYHCNASDQDNQLWNISVSHPGAGADGGDLVMIANQKDNLCFDLPDKGGKPYGTRVVESPCNNGMDDNQQWRIENLPDGSKKLHNFASRGKCLMVHGNSNDPDAPLTIGPCDTPTSNWYIRQ
ncbi:RICIN domain-containing protein [Streptomyces sp. ODS28]|uniref:RICIN domain-containing protein n=1 Tax=Streptomyces sp. ODS28 TaxID=3136688 RepID=UPI0031EFBC08